MTTPLIALVGRPNVGKSTLFNKLVGGRPALVHDTPGLTRDLRYGEVDYFGHALRVVDTGGLDPAAQRDVIGAGIHDNAMRAIGMADALVLVVDATVGLAAVDQDLARILRATGKPLFLVANKLDHPNHDTLLPELYRLGLGDPLPVSAAHGRGIDDMLQAVVDRLQVPRTVAAEDDDADEADDERSGAGPATIEDDRDGDQAAEPTLDSRRRPLAVATAAEPLRVAFVGRPNAGKSSLTNRLLGEERSLVHHEAGTTTDPVDTPFQLGDRHYTLVDTAGNRRNAKVDHDIEKIAVSMAIGQLERADIVVLVLDGELGPSEQEARLAGMIEQAGRGLVLAVNKVDLIKTPARREELRAAIEDTFHFLPWAPVVWLSARRGDGVDRLLDTVVAVARNHRRRVTTAHLNRFFAEVVEHTPPPIHRGRATRIHYLTQGAIRPPTFLLFVNQPEGLSPAYRRFLVNQLRKRYDFKGTPLRVFAKDKHGGKEHEREREAPAGGKGPGAKRRPSKAASGRALAAIKPGKKVRKPGKKRAPR